MSKKAEVNMDMCMACGACEKSCSVGAIKLSGGSYAKVDPDKCVYCQKCMAVCPAGAIG